MNKFEIKQYVERVYGIGVIKVNTQVIQGKMKVLFLSQSPLLKSPLSQSLP